jgi:2-polyprenyl-3-methyl-5-hydroxy-6-metoxy-1,4-benzoquinol methylase
MVRGARETPDIETSSDGYASRFAGAAGQFMLSVQEAGVLALLGSNPSMLGRTVLDVGGGHMQLAGPLTRHGCEVTVFGSDDRCAARLNAGPFAGQVRFKSGDLLALPFSDRQFDTVVSVRLISHMEDWRGLVAELCRVAGQSIIIDYPTLASLNALSLVTFPLKRAIEKNTRTYRSFRSSELREAFGRNGFQPVRSYKQFVEPMAAHRLFGRTGIVRGVEQGLRAAGVTRLIGNPVLLRLDRVVK